MANKPRALAFARRAGVDVRWVRTAWDVFVRVARSPWLAGTAAALLLVPLTLTATGILEIRMSSDGIQVSRGAKATAGAGPHIAGGWHGEISDMQFGEFSRVLSYELDVTLTRRGDTVWVEGHFTTDSVAGGRYIGHATFTGVGTVSGDEFIRLPYDVDRQGKRGFGILLLQIAPGARQVDGYALYRRSKLENGRMGLGKATFKRSG